MAVLKSDKDSVEVKDGMGLVDAGDKLGVPFGCQEGICGSCLVEVVEGEDNLSAKSSSEEFADLDDHKRLLCQCKIKSGEVKIKF